MNDLPLMSIAEYIGWCLGTGVVLRIITDGVHGVHAILWSLFRGVYQR